MKKQGALILVVGPSGAGKDTLMREAAALLKNDDSIIFPKRLVTRRPDASLEDHGYISREDFEEKSRSGDCCLSWEAHGLGYLIPSEVGQQIETGTSAVFNGSRSVIPEGMRKFPGFAVIKISVPRDVLRERLLARGRESADEVERRLQRSDYPVHPCPRMTEISNDGPPALGGRKLAEAIRHFTIF